MTRKSSTIQHSSLLRSLHVSFAGARAGGAMMADKALNRIIPGRSSNPLLAREAQKLVAKLGQMKGTYVKAGQMLALVGEYVLPPELTEALHTLESATTPLPWSEVEAVLRTRLGEQYGELDIEKEPIGVASLAQVHRATIRQSGEQICLKLLYPGVRESIESDFNAVTRMLKLTRWVKLSRGFDDWMQQLRQQLLHEVDYPREIRMTERAAQLLGGDARYRVPRIYHQYCSDSLIAMEYLEGLAVTDPQIAALSQERRNSLAQNMLDLFFQEVYQWQLLQSDPNFGNYRIAIGAHSDQLILLDFGSVLDVGQGFFQALGDTITAAQCADVPLLTDGLIRLGCLTESSSEEATSTFVNFCIEIMEPMRAPEELPEHLLNSEGHYCWSESKLMKRAALIAANSMGNRDFDLPSEQFALVTRKLLGIFTFISLLQAEFNGAPILEKHLR
ncbi:AarF/ABC1/UbiB kinase family protein [Pseudomaricurvus alcaniphilus]|uniref:AarF/UbiB family protein n=1 Tax=Pseudomaricurvus alcaniphilus TaxID=1166482 RepID=UPI001407D888|nr:AarF/UbiB family protein [Pseudomaricurvus alcaniphilus]NHN36998.1 AarF/ABC1/UbiB kinase family protein [Pseudomaricurvus alcaniphilus]